MSFKGEFSTDGTSYATNALRFETEAEAETYAASLFSRWMGAVAYRVAPSDDPVNHAVVGNTMKRVAAEEVAAS